MLKSNKSFYWFVGLYISSLIAFAAFSISARILLYFLEKAAS